MARKLRADLDLEGNDLIDVGATETVAVATDLMLFKDTTDATVKGLDWADLPGHTRSWSMAVYDSDTDVAVGNGKIGFCVPLSMDAMDITDVVASVHASGTTGTTDVQIRRRRGATDADVLTTKVTIDSAEHSSTTAAAAHSVNTANDDLNEGDLIYVDVDAVSTTAPKGLTVTITATLP